MWWNRKTDEVLTVLQYVCGIHATVVAAAFHYSMGSFPEPSTGVVLGSKGWVQRLVITEMLVAFRFESASRLEALNE